eukprot:m.1639078 g.1639078  ORF g.1639078 m.1639078 type:complete len:53 (-) comp32935_c0_seq1:72-230(-)
MVRESAKRRHTQSDTPGEGVVMQKLSPIYHDRVHFRCCLEFVCEYVWLCLDD